MESREVEDFLKQHDLGGYLGTFQQEQIFRLSELRMCTDDTLKEMGFKTGPRLRIRAALNAEKTVPGGQTVQSTPESGVDVCAAFFRFLAVPRVCSIIAACCRSSQ